MDSEKWTTPKNVGNHYQILEQTFFYSGFAFKNATYSADEHLSESIKFHLSTLGRTVSFDETRFQLDMTEGDKNTSTTIAKELSDKGQTHALRAGDSAIVVGGSVTNGFAPPAHIIVAVERIQVTWTRIAPNSDIVDVSKDLPLMSAAPLPCSTTGTMKHDDGAIQYLKLNILPSFQGSHAVSLSNSIVLICGVHASNMTYVFLIFCHQMSVVLVLRPLYTIAAWQGGDRRNFRLVKGGWRVARHKKLAESIA